MSLTVLGPAQEIPVRWDHAEGSKVNVATDGTNAQRGGKNSNKHARPL